MAKQTTPNELPEVKKYRELKGQMEIEQKKLSEAEDELTKLNTRLKELEAEDSKIGLKKKAALERHASNEISLSELKSEVRKHFINTTQEQNDTKELIDVVETVIEKQKDTLLQLQQQIRDISNAIWGRIADVYQKKLENAIGDTANFLWVAMRNANPHVSPFRSHELPEGLKKLATPDQPECENLRKKLWSEFVGEN
ncbi:MAG: hypothetical protein E3K37_01615 [Candidatus Kuenenia sp.]|nr:hypothetical protein [Candidatus Kuenenia hertensis]